MRKPRCIKCGRVLHDPVSIARGMGPLCAGISGGNGSAKLRVGQRSSARYRADLSSGVQTFLPIVGTAPKQSSQKESGSQSREERRRLFDERKPFECGLSLPERIPVLYVPTEDGGWKMNSNGNVISHEQLQNYLRRYQFI